MKRSIVRIDQRLCNGCGLCISPCAEGAIAMVNGKAQVIKEELCDGAGICLNVCPTRALTIEEREAEPFSAEAVEQHREELMEADDRCIYCGINDEYMPLVAIRFKGRRQYVCARCLPKMIHG